jgi:uroporphyrinogen-III synthase
MKVKNILISQHTPVDFEKSPYAELTKKFSINIDFYKFFRVENISATEFRKSKINILDHDVIFFASKNAVDHFFELCKDLRLEMPDKMKYICTTDQVAYYLQNYVQYRKRKILFGKHNNPAGVFDLFQKNKTERFLLPCSEDSSTRQYIDFFAKYRIQYTQAVIFRAVSENIKDNIKLEKYDMVIFFSPYGIQAFKENYPDFEQKELIFGALGQNTATAIQAEGWKLDVMAPTKETPSITAAMSMFLKDNATRRR